MLNLLGAFFLFATVSGKPVWLGDMSCGPEKRCDGIFKFSSRDDCVTAGMLINGLLPGDSVVTCQNSDGVVTDRWER